MRARRFGEIGPALLLVAILTPGSASAYDPYDPRNCIGFDWDDKRALVVQKVTAKPRVNFIKSPYDDDFKAETCPAATEACRKTSYLVAGDMGHRQDAGRVHLHLLPGESAEIGQGLAAEHGADGGRADGVAEDFGLARHLVAPRWRRYDHARRRRQIAY